MSSPLIEEGSAALRAGDAASARRAFEFALAEVESGEVLEGLAEALYLDREYAASAAHYERAYAAYRRERQGMGAGRAARTVAWITGSILGDWAVQSGWWARAWLVARHQELLRTGPTGVRGHGRHGRPVTEAARVVVGADGRHSLMPAPSSPSSTARSHRCWPPTTPTGAGCPWTAASGARPFDAAMGAYQATRDRQVLPMYELTTQLATLEPPPPDLQRLLAAARGNQEAMDGFARVIAGVTSPAEFFSGQSVGRILAQAAYASDRSG